MTARDAVTARKHLETLLFCAQKTKSNMWEAVGTDRVSTLVLTDLQPWLFDPDKEFVSRLHERLTDTRPIDPLEYHNFFALVIISVPAVMIGFAVWASRDLPTQLDQLYHGMTWPEEAE
jgi:hypothetical protein